MLKLEIQTKTSHHIGMDRVTKIHTIDNIDVYQRVDENREGYPRDIVLYFVNGDKVVSQLIVDTISWGKNSTINNVKFQDHKD